MKHVLEEGANYSLTPSNIDVTKRIPKVFGNMETEASAHYLVKLAQKKEGWKPFIREEIESLYNESGYVNFRFNRLTSEGWIVERDGKFFFTAEFVARCWGS